MEEWRVMCQQALDDGWSAEPADPPGDGCLDPEGCAESCRRNLCGCYGTSWACPPGWTEGMASLCSRFPSAIVLSKRFDEDPLDEGKVASASESARRMVRSITASMRAAGISCIGLGDGACGYCGVCSYPEPCRFPEQLIPSVSATGLDISRYLAGMGRPFEFRKDSFTLYAIILFDPVARGPSARAQ